MTSSLEDLLDRILTTSGSQAEKGTRFEELIAAYLRSAPEYADRFTEVHLWQDWAGRHGRADHGIDIVAKEADGRGWCAIQCKYYAPTSRIAKDDIDSFLSASGKQDFTSRMMSNLLESSIDLGRHRPRAPRRGAAHDRAQAAPAAPGRGDAPGRRRLPDPRPRQADHGLRHREDPDRAADRAGGRAHPQGRAVDRPLPGPAVEWIMDRYRVRTDKKSGIVNDPNDWSREVGDPRYVVDLLARIVTVSLDTMKVVDSLPPLDILEDQHDDRP